MDRFFSLALDLLCIADREGTFRRLNGACETTLGYRPAELEGTRLEDLVHPEDVTLTRSAIGDLTAGSSIVSFVNRCRSREGAYRWIEWRAFPYEGTCIYATGRDITEHRRFQQVVLEQKKVLETVLANMAQAMLIVDAEIRVVAFNQRFEPLFGFAPGEIRAGESLEKSVRLWATRTDTSAAQLDKVLGALRKREPFVSEYRQRVDGHESWIQLFHNPLPQGGFVRTYTDVTERKRAEEALKLARAAADAANQAKSQFLASMSHELRTPLSAIIGYSEMLKDEAREENLHHFSPDLEKITAAARHLLSLINDVLDLSKIEAGRMQISPEKFAVEPVVSEVTSTVHPLIEGKRNLLIVSGAETTGYMTADPMRVKQILFNLLSNAAKFTEDGSIALACERSAEAGHDWITFTVTDTGIGMTAEQLGKLFQAFSQADASITKRFGGTGLGLAISRRLCQMMGGEITAASRAGEGSTFTVKLPAA